MPKYRITALRRVEQNAAPIEIEAENDEAAAAVAAQLDRDKRFSFEPMAWTHEAHCTEFSARQL